MKPEQKIYQRLKRELTKLLPKGHFMLQRIETSTGSGVPDVYFSQRNEPTLLLTKSNFDIHHFVSNFDHCWIETKTKEYKVSNEQLSWAHLHHLAGGITLICTEHNDRLLFLEFDDRMSDFPTLDSYLKAKLL